MIYDEFRHHLSRWHEGPRPVHLKRFCLRPAAEREAMATAAATAAAVAVAVAFSPAATAAATAAMAADAGVFVVVGMPCKCGGMPRVSTSESDIAGLAKQMAIT